VSLEELAERIGYVETSGTTTRGILRDLIAHLAKQSTTAPAGNKTHEEMPEHIADCREEMARRRDYLQAKLGDARQWRNFYDLCDAVTERLTAAQREVASLRHIHEGNVRMQDDLRAKLEAAERDRGISVKVEDTLRRQRDEARAELDRVTKELDDAWQSTGVAASVRGLTTLADVVQTNRADLQREREKRAVAVPREEWHEDDGDVLWWTMPISEPPYVGTPLDDGFPDYVTHWTRIVVPGLELAQAPAPALSREEAERLAANWYHRVDNWPDVVGNIRELADLLLSTVAKYGSGAEHVVTVEPYAPANRYRVLLNGEDVYSSASESGANMHADAVRAALAKGRTVDAGAMVTKTREEALREAADICEEYSALHCDEESGGCTNERCKTAAELRDNISNMARARTASGAGEKGDVET